MTQHQFAGPSHSYSFVDVPVDANRSLIRTVGKAFAATVFAAAFSACGFVSNGSGSADPAADAATDPAATAASTETTQAVETAAPNRAATPTVARPTANSNATTTTTAGATTSTTTTPTTTPTPAGATINTLDTIVNDMKLANDMPLRGYESRTVGWYVGPGYVFLGNDPRMTNAPQWFKDSFSSYINGTYMRALLPWLVIFDAPTNAATNTRVHVRNMRAYWKSRSTGQWRMLGLSPGVSGFVTPKSTLVNGNIAEDKRYNPDGSVEIKPPSDPNYVWHGWWNNGRATIDPTDIEAWLITAHARLTVDDTSRADDRAAARLMIQMGADYYYDANWTWNVGAPGVGTSRSKRVTNDWQAFNLFTFNDVGIQEPGGGISEAAFRANPPPLE